MEIPFEKAFANESSTIRDAMQIMDSSSLRIVLVVDEFKTLLGIVTDGDIRRAILKGMDFNTSISKIMNRSPKVALASDSKKVRINLMKRNEIISIPIVDESRKVVGLDLLSNHVKMNGRENLVFLFAGGFGQRLKPLTDDTPKPLLQVGSKPILESILERFISFGFRKFCFSLHYLPEKIKSHFGGGEKWGVEISYVYEESPLGTAGALSLLPPGITDLPLIVMNGDLLTKVNFDQLLDFHNKVDNEITVGVRDYSFQVPYGVITHKDGSVIELKEKPVHEFFVNAGIYVIEPDVLEKLEYGKTIDMPELLRQQVSLGKQVGMFPIHEYWLDIGKMHDFEKAQLDFHKHFN